MKLIDTGNITDPYINLALDEYCVRNLPLNDEYAILYINEPSVILGKHQNPLEEVNINFIKENKIKLARRISGGGTVYHDQGNLNFGFVSKFAQNRIHNFRYFTKPVLNALKKLGVNAKLNERSDILVDGFKVSGNAQFSNTKAVLSHGTLLYDSNLHNLSASLKPQIDLIESKAVKSVRNKVANLKDYIEPEIDLHELTGEIKRSLNKEFTIEDFELSDNDWRNIFDLAHSKYGKWEWVYGRTPDFKVSKSFTVNETEVPASLFVRDGLIADIDFNGYPVSENTKSDLSEKILNTNFNF